MRLLGIALTLALVTGMVVPTARAERADEGAAAPLAASIAGGAAVGFAIGGVWVLHDRASEDDPWPAGVAAGLLAGGAVAGAAIGGVAAQLRLPTWGQVMFTPAAAGLMAAVVGLTAGALTAGDAHRDDHAALAAAIAIETGVMAAGLIGRRWRPAPRDVVFMTALAVIVGLASGTIAFRLDDEASVSESRVSWAAGASGAALGGALGIALVRR